MTSTEPTSPAPAAEEQASANREELANQFFATIKAFKRHFEHAAPNCAIEDMAGVTSHQLEALVWLMSSPGGIPMNDLARAQGVGLSSCTALADRLVRHGLAVRTSDPADRRVVRLAATDRAQAIVGQFQQARRARLLELLAVLDDDEVATLVRLLRTVASADTAQTQP